MNICTWKLGLVGVRTSSVCTSPGCSRPFTVASPPGSMFWLLSYHVSETLRRGIGAFIVFFTVIFVMSVLPSRRVGDFTYSISAWPLTGGTNFLPARIDCIGGACGFDC
jgi:hypothetical protein